MNEYPRSLMVRNNLADDCFSGVRHFVVELYELDEALPMETQVRMRHMRTLDLKNGPGMEHAVVIVMAPTSWCDTLLIDFCENAFYDTIASFRVHEIHCVAGMVLKGEPETTRFFFPDYGIPIEEEYFRKDNRTKF